MTNKQVDLIGVITPVYKVEKYIAECIESILAQTHTNFRLILVDDGTPDNAGKICDEYAKKDSRITVIHQENAGVTRARARGVEEATDCEFITFVDGDDTIAQDALESLYSFCNNDIDIVISIFDNSYTPDKTKIDYAEYRHLAVKNDFFIGAACGKLIKRKIINTHIFEIPSYITVYEDFLMNVRIAFNTGKNIIFCQKCIYNYRKNENGATLTNHKSIEYETELYEQVKISIPQKDFNKYLKDTIPYRLLQWRNFYMYKYKVSEMKKEKYYIELRDDIKKSNFSLSPVEFILFHCTNPFVRFLAINIKKIQNKLCIKNR